MTLINDIKASWAHPEARSGMILMGFLVTLPLTLGAIGNHVASTAPQPVASAPRVAPPDSHTECNAGKAYCDQLLETRMWANRPAVERYGIDPVTQPANELAWLSQDPALAKRMHAECGDLTKVQCEKYWEIKRAERGAGERETYGEFLERGRQRSNDLAFCRQNPSDWYCRNGQYSGQY